MAPAVALISAAEGRQRFGHAEAHSATSILAADVEAVCAKAGVSVVSATPMRAEHSAALRCMGDLLTRMDEVRRQPVTSLISFARQSGGMVDWAQ